MERENMPDRSAFELPPCATEFIADVARKMHYRKRVRQEVHAELTAHFEDELRDSAGAEQREQRARRLIGEFGDTGLLAVLCRRAKKRCRPLWTKVAIRGLQATGIVLLYGLLCSLRLFVGTPSLKVDYLAWLSDRTRAGREESLNAKAYFDKAAKSLWNAELPARAFGIAHRWPEDVNEAQRKVLADLAEQYADAFDTLRQGVTKPYYWIRYERAVYELLPSGMPEPSRSMEGLDTLPDPTWGFNRATFTCVPEYKMLAQAFYALIWWRAYQGDVRSALDDCLVLMDFGMHLEGRGTQVEQLAGVAIEAMGYHTMLELLSRHGAHGVDLARIQSRLVGLYARYPSILDVAGDRAVWLSLVQQTFTDDEEGNGRLLKEGLPLAAGDWQDGVTSLLFFDYPDRREMTSLIDAFLKEYQSTLETEPSHPQYEKRKIRWMALAQKSFLLGKQVPAMERLAALVWRVKTGRRAVLTTVATLRYAQDKGVYPATLDTLVAERYMSELPLDPYGAGAFGYRLTPDGFLLYSWGENLQDDGGQQGTRQDGRPRMWANNGDCVFWPVTP